jgi:CrtC N-terminal lipocalin domain
MYDDFALRLAGLILLICFIVIITEQCKRSRIFPPNVSLTAQSVQSLDDMKSMLQQRLNYIESRRSFLTPVNSAMLSKVKDLISTATIDNIPTIMELLPGNRLGFLPLAPLPGPDKAVLFKFEQGRIGWYFGYLTFADQNSSFFWQVNRVELLPRSERQKYYSLGQSTIYNIAVGVSVNGQFYRSEYYTAPGTYTIHNDVTFEFSTADGSFKMAHLQQADGSYAMAISFNQPMTALDSGEGPASAQIEGSFTITTSQPIAPDGKNYCQPCLWGDGTLYGSYTDLHGEGTIQFGTDSSSLKNLSGGIGWMDHQWGGSEPSSIFGKLAYNALKGGQILNQLPRYLWLNLHLSDRQYMIFAFPKEVPVQGKAFSVTFNKYTTDGQKFMQSGANVVSNSTVMFNGVSYTTSWLITIEGQLYLLDGRSFGTSAVTDINGVDHWVGSARISDENGNIVGTGFMEEARFMDDNTFLNTLWKRAGWTGGDMEAFTNSTRDTFSFVGSFISVLVLFILVFVFIISTATSGYKLISPQ